MKNNLSSLASSAGSLPLINNSYISDRIMKDDIPVYKGMWELIFIAQMCIILLMIG